MESRTKEKILSLIRETTTGFEIKSLITDGFKVYEGVAKELGVKHQRCIFHMFKECREEIINDIEKMNSLN